MSGFPAHNDYVASLVPGAATHTFMNSAIGAWSVAKSSRRLRRGAAGAKSSTHGGRGPPPPRSRHPAIHPRILTAHAKSD